jgi:hypothetical protein
MQPSEFTKLGSWPDLRIFITIWISVFAGMTGLMKNLEKNNSVRAAKVAHVAA